MERMTRQQHRELLKSRQQLVQSKKYLLDSHPRERWKVFSDQELPSNLSPEMCRLVELAYWLGAESGYFDRDSYGSPEVHLDTVLDRTRSAIAALEEARNGGKR